ncbi:MAG: phosphocarrier protein HPr [Elusimicrobia bacterium RIFCSPHIGHO2_02_FULL_57_9]|nr:MAG: phosphocarrier protein HPr [Elusimicrobia bacterium RIFCSPHIGHO2_02_FULL_57_9]
MVQREFSVTNRLGLHARPAALFVHEAGRFKSSIFVAKDGLEINGKSVMGLMLLAAECGAKIMIKADGPDEGQAIEALGKLFEKKFDEE